LHPRRPARSAVRPRAGPAVRGGRRASAVARVTGPTSGRWPAVRSRMDFSNPSCSPAPAPLARTHEVDSAHDHDGEGVRPPAAVTVAVTTVGHSRRLRYLEGQLLGDRNMLVPAGGLEPPHAV